MTKNQLNELKEIRDGAPKTANYISIQGYVLNEDSDWYLWLPKKEEYAYLVLYDHEEPWEFQSLADINKLIEQADEIVTLREQVVRLIEDRARFPDRPDDIGNMIDAHIKNKDAAVKSSNEYAEKYMRRAEHAERELAQAQKKLAIEQECYEKNACDSLDLLAECSAENDKLRKQLAKAKQRTEKVTAERDELKKWLTGVYSLAAYMRFNENYDNATMSEVVAFSAKLDLEQQADGVEYFANNKCNKNLDGEFAYKEAMLSFSSDLRKQANEVGK